MSKYCKKLVVVDAEQWFQNGDHSLDEHKRGTPTEGKLVRRYRTPDDRFSSCELCHYPMQNHGWLESPTGGCKVCPGDWIIQNANGTFHICCSAVFEALYTSYDDETAKIRVPKYLQKRK